MEKIKKLFSGKPFRIFKWTILVLISAFVVLIIIRFFHYFNVQKTNKQVEKIHSTKLIESDVIGDNLPPSPGIDSDKTIQGVDANHNGIRDDVEIAIFNKYPNLVKTRAVLLQYALVLQMETIQPFVNTTIATEIAREEGRANTCLSDNIVPRKSSESSRTFSDIEKINSYINFIEDKQFNTKERKDYRNNFLKNVRSFSDLDYGCDLDLSKLPN